MRILNNVTELQIRFRPDECDNFINMVLESKYTPFRKELVDKLRTECLI